MADQGPFGSGSVAEGYREFLEPVIFGPWAERLIDFAGIDPGQSVLDVASGTGVAARAAAAAVGAGGRVIASDISAGMLAQVNPDRALDSRVAPIETLECSATELRLPDAAVDVVLCQQGFPFIPDRAAAAREMRRVLRAGGRVAVAVWLENPRVEPFIVYADALRAIGLPEPFPNGYDTSANSMAISQVKDALDAAGLVEIVVATEELELQWPDVEHAVRGVMGTPYGPVLAGLDDDRQHAVMVDLRDRMTAPGGGPVRHRMTAVLGRGTAR